jgi:hypothetical protein
VKKWSHSVTTTSLGSEYAKKVRNHCGEKGER